MIFFNFLGLSVLLSLQQCAAISVAPCRNNKVAPKLGPEGRTFGYLLGLRPRPLGALSGCDPSLAEQGDEQQVPDYVDPVYSGEDSNDFSNSPQQPSRPSQGGGSNNDGIGGFLNWVGGTPDRWPTRPPRPPPPPVMPPSDWLWGWFGQQSNYPNRPERPPYQNTIGQETKPVHEVIDDDSENVSWRPGMVVGGPNNNIIGVSQDLSSWTRPPTPRPTRPSIPGYGGGGSRNNNQGIIGSFIDLLFK